MRIRFKTSVVTCPENGSPRCYEDGEEAFWKDKADALKLIAADYAVSIETETHKGNK